MVDFRSLELELAQVLEVEEMAGVDLVDGDRPQRRVVEVTQVLVLPLDRPGGIGVGQVVVGARRLRLERSRGPHAGERPAVEIRRRRDHDRLAGRHRDDVVALDEPRKLLHLLLRGLGQLPRRRVTLLRLPPRLGRIAAVHPRGHAPELLLGVVELSERNRQEPVDAERDPLFQLELLLELLAADPERGPRPGRELALEVVDVRAQGVGRLGRRVGEIAEHVQVVHVGKRLRQVGLDQLQHPAHRLEADLDEDPRRVLDVLPRRLQQPRRLAQLRQHAARPLLDRGVVEEHLPGEARREDVGIELRVALPHPHLLELEQPRADVRPDHRVLDSLDRGQRVQPDLIEPPREARQCARLVLDGRTAQILEQIVVGVNPIEGRVRRVGLVKVRKVVLDEVNQRFG